jgi:hypothetical protein
MSETKNFQPWIAYQTPSDALKKLPADWLTLSTTVLRAQGSFTYYGRYDISSFDDYCGNPGCQCRRLVCLGHHMLSNEHK